MTNEEKKLRAAVRALLIAYAKDKSSYTISDLLAPAGEQGHLAKLPPDAGAEHNKRRVLMAPDYLGLEHSAGTRVFWHNGKIYVPDLVGGIDMFTFREGTINDLVMELFGEAS
jgi:hypothetical protein